MRHSLQWSPIFAFLVIVFAACNASRAQPANTGEMRHPNGLRSISPKGFTPERIPEGFEFAEQGNLRVVKRIMIVRNSRKPSAPTDQSNIVSSGRHYVVQNIGGGSGGTEYRLTAWKQALGGWIVLTAYDQVELFEPDFSVAWGVLKQATLVERLDAAPPQQ